MKKLFLLGAMSVVAMVVSGCAGNFVADRWGFATVAPGPIVSDMKGGLFIQPRHPARKFQILGKVKAEALTTSYLMLVSIGDASYQTLKKAALEKYRDADDIIDVDMDFRNDNLLGLINKVHVTLEGTAIRYTDLPAAK